jgi:shikimate kinase
MRPKSNKQPIVITGFMAAGKTRVALALANLLGRAAIDLDDLVTKSTGRTPGEIIEQDGEASFRQIETDALRSALKENAVVVIALGGGAWINPENRLLINQFNCRTVWLDAPFALCWMRIIATAAHRPLAPDEAATRNLYNQRRDLYQLAQLRIEMDESATAEGIARQITLLL